MSIKSIVPRLALAGLSLLAIPACQGDPGLGDHVSESFTGDATVALTLPDGTSIDVITWTITGGNLTAPLTGSIPVPDPTQTVIAKISGIPRGSGYTIELDGVSDGGTSCLGEANFSLLRSSTRVAVSMNCSGGSTSGEVDVSAEFNQCPVIESYTASPIEVAVGHDVILSALATDADGDSLRYDWQSTDGTFTSPRSANTRFVCSEAGPAALTLVVDDGHGCDVSTGLRVTCTEPPDVSFQIAGLKPLYQVGETLEVGVAGITLEDGQTVYWLLRTPDHDSLSTTVESGEAMAMPLDAWLDDAELQASIEDADGNVVAETAWVAIQVQHQGDQPVITQVGTAMDPLLAGDSIEFRVSGRELAEGESFEWDLNILGGLLRGALALDWRAEYPTADTIRLTSVRNMDPPGYGFGPLAVRVVTNGVAVARSELRPITLGFRDVVVAGQRTIYREGTPIRLDGSVDPIRDTDDFTYEWVYTKGTTTEIWGTELNLVGPALVAAVHQGGRIQLNLYNHGVLVQSTSRHTINVTTATGQIVELGSLSGHYHQGNTIRLNLTIDPALGAGDSMEWQWKWPGADWTPIPGFTSGLVQQLMAEQALDGVEVRVLVTYADPATAPIASRNRTILVDDHGAPARQVITVSGATSVAAGAPVALTASVAASTLLSTYRWEKKASGQAEFTVVEGEGGATLSFTATAEDDGAEYRASIVKPGGQVAYGPSAAVALNVE